MAALNDGLYRLGAQYGEVLTTDTIPKVVAEIIEITATIEINRIDMPLVGTTRMGYKPGRESREGTFRIQYVDSYWSLEVYRYLSQSLEARRAARRAGLPSALKPFNLQMSLDDPNALGYETWLLEGCLLWRLPLGFNIGDDIIDREFPFTWEKETPVASFRRTGTLDAAGYPAVTQFSAANPLPLTG